MTYNLKIMKKRFTKRHPVIKTPNGRVKIFTKTENGQEYKFAIPLFPTLQTDKYFDEMYFYN